MSNALIVIFICSFIAFSISAVCGGGAGLMIMPLLNRLLPVNQIPGALSIGTLTSSVSRIIVFRKHVCWKIVRYFVPAALPAVWLGAWLLKFVNPVYLEIMMGIFLVSNLPFLFRKPADAANERKVSNAALSLIGFLAGFLSGLTGAVGLLFNKFYLNYGLSKEEIIATRAANEVLLHLFKIILYSLFGLIGIHVLKAGALIALAAILASWMMKWVLPLLSLHRFKKIGYFAMVISGLMMLGQAGKGLINEKNIHISAGIREQNLETKIQWQNAGFAMEFNFDEGFEFEQIIPLESLSQEKKQFIRSKNQAGYRVVVEQVYTIRSTFFEAYFYDGETLVTKFDFN